MSNSTALFHSHKLLIYSRVHYFAKRYNLEVQDLKSEAFEIFCEAVEKFNPKQAKFSTFLYHRLRKLNDYCRKETSIRQRERAELLESAGNYDFPGPIYKNPDPAFTYSQDFDSLPLFQEAAKSLSEDGKKVLVSILSRDFEAPKIREREQSQYKIVKTLIESWGWSRKRAVQTWEELKSWWTNLEPAFN